MTSPGAETRQTIADPAPLGLAAFALTTFTFCGITAGWLPSDEAAVALAPALLYGGIAQFVAGIIALFRNDVFAGTALASYGCFWAGHWYLGTHDVFGLGADAGQANGYMTLGWAIFTVFLLIGSWRVSYGMFATFVVLLPAFIFLALGGLLNSTGLTQVGAYLGFITGLLAWYNSAAGVLNPLYGRPILPVGARA